MDHRRFDITVNSANGLDGVRTIGQLRAYVVVFVSNNQAAQQKTQIDETGNTNPAWNSTMIFSVSEIELRHNHDLCIVFQLHYQRTLGDKCLGEVRVPLRDLFTAKASVTQFTSYPIIRSNKSTKGLLHFSYRFHELASVKANQQSYSTLPQQNQGNSTTINPQPNQSSMAPQQNQGNYTSVNPQPNQYSMPPQPPRYYNTVPQSNQSSMAPQKNQGNNTPVNPQPNQYPMPPQPPRYYNTVPQHVPNQPNSQPVQKSKSERLQKIGLMIGMGGLMTGVGGLAVNAVGLGKKNGGGDGGEHGGSGSGAVDPATEHMGGNNPENHNMGSDPVGFEQNHQMGFDPVGLEDPNAVFGSHDHVDYGQHDPLIDDFNMAFDQQPIGIPDSSGLFFDQPSVPDTSSVYIPDFSGFNIG